MSMRDKFRDHIHDRIKVLVLGDSGVGKSCLVNLICQPHSSNRPSWTIGCSIEVFLHQFNEGTPNHRSCLIELWDVGGYKTHSLARSIFYDSYQGIILVHDLTNRKSYLNLRQWLGEVLTASDGTQMKEGRIAEEFDPEIFIGKNIPVLIVGTKKDLLSANAASRPRPTSLTEECGAFEIEINCLDSRAFAPGLTNCAEMTRFFDKVIERKYTLSDRMRSSSSSGLLYNTKSPRSHVD
ncbi:rab-like protein 3 [Brevipalpus obovatus]|uniref:rab-like protein 3 n=1 Tax=Brevipalpus obovatus TaxID=246614 RepID=UPI003D9F47DD